MNQVTRLAAAPPNLSRRSLLLAAATAACGPPKAQGYRGYCFVVNLQSCSVAAIDLSRFRLRKQIPVDAAPAAILAHPSQPKAYVLAPDAGTVYEIDSVKLAISRQARAGDRAISMAIAPNNDALWILYAGPAELVELPFDSLRPRRRIRLTSQPAGFDLSSTNYAAIASCQDRTITVASLERGAIDRVIAARDEPSLLHFRTDGEQIVAGSYPDRALTIFHTMSGKTVVRLPLAIAPRHFCPDGTGGQLYVTGDGMDALVIVYPYETEIGQTILAGHAPGAMAVTQGASPLLLVANPDTDRVTALDVNTMGKSLIAVVDVGQEPCSIVTTPGSQPDNQYALVLNRKSGDVAVIRSYSLNQAGPFKEPLRKPTPVFTMIPVGDRPVAAAVVPWSHEA
jgi:DNA-binding beta-propeller fold protein YncE